jgi:5-methylcytosine-specific restriction endonuclease McrA
MTQPRRFNARQKVAMSWASGGRCMSCSKPLLRGWHGDHRKSWTNGGPTTCANGQALCQDCNLRKGANDHVIR